MRNRAFSLIEVLISIVVLALGLLGIAAVFPAVVTQQRSTTDSVQGASLQESVKEYITSHRLLNRASVKPGNNGGPIDPADQRGWQLLLCNSTWSRPVSPNNGLCDGNFEVENTTDITSAGINTDLTSGVTVILNKNATAPSVTLPPTVGPTQALLDEPIAWIPVSERQLPIWSSRQNVSGAPRPEALYVWDMAVRRLGSGIPYPKSPPAPTQNQIDLSLQDDLVQVAVFIRRKDKPTARNTSPQPVGEDNAGRPTFDGTGQYSVIHEAPYTVPSFDPASASGATNLLDFNNEPNARYLGQVGQKLVDQWGEVHEVIAADLQAANHVVVTIRSTTQRVDTATNELNEGVKAANLKAYLNAGVPLKMIYTTQVPVSVSVFDVRPRALPRT